MDRTLKPREAPLAHLVGPGAIRLERRVSGPVERVWAHLVDPALRATWLAGGDIEPHVGGRVTLAFRHAQITDDAPPAASRSVHEHGHVAHGVVTDWQPLRRLAHTWDDGEEASEVTFELGDDGDHVRMTVTHRRLETPAAVVSVAAGWDAHLETLAARLEGKPRPAFWQAHARSEARHAEAFAGQVDAEGRPAEVARLRSDPGGHRLEYRRRIFASLDRVWQVLAEPALRDRWYPAELRFEGPVGGWVRESFPDDPTPLPVGTLTAWDPRHRLAFTVEADPGSSEPSVRHPQEVTIETEADGDTTRLNFVYRFGDRSLAPAFGAGWHVCLDALAAVAEGREARSVGSEVRRLYDAWLAGVAAPVTEPARR